MTTLHRAAKAAPLYGFLAAALVLAPTPTKAGDELRVIIRDSHVPGIPVLVRVEVRDALGELKRDLWDAEATLSTTTAGVTLSPDRITLRNGMGSALVALEVDAPADVALRVDVGDDLDFFKTLSLLDLGDAQEVSGELPSGLTEWSGIVNVTSDTRVPADGTLRIAAGTLVLLNGVPSGSDGSDLNVDGTLEVDGTEDRPVTFTAIDPDEPWGEIHHDNAEPSTYRYAVITRAGRSPRGGHTNTGPAVRPEDSTITFESTTISDHVGKVMQARGSELIFRDTMLARAVMGPEIDGSSLLLEDSFIIEMFGNDDNDGIYIHDQRAGQEVIIDGCIVAAGDDDGIDTLGADNVIVRDTITRDWADKGMSFFHENLTVERCQIVHNRIGISAKTGNNDTMLIRVDHCTFVDNCMGIEARDKSGTPDATINYVVTNSIIREIDPARRNEVCEDDDDIETVRTDFDPADLTVRFSDLSTELEGMVVEANITSDPMFMAPAERNYRLQAASPCIDAGDPDFPPDADGSRTEMGAFPFEATEPPDPEFVRGDVNGDGSIDISDPISGVLHLFSGLPIGCRDAADANDDGRHDLSDSIYSLGFQFRGSLAPPTPFPGCGTDPTEDIREDITADLGCAESGCP